MGTPDLLLTIRYRDKTHTLTYAADSEAGRTIGRGDLQRWFGLPADALINISKAHFTVVFSNGRYWIDEHSSFGSLARVHDGPLLPPYRKRRRARLALGRRTELLLSNTNRADNSADHVYVFIDNPAASDTLAVFTDPLWDQLLRRLESGRTAHLLGLPGSGKWHLARQLMADDNHDRERVLGLSMLPIAVDCRAISAGDQPLWLAFARRLLLAMSEAADRAGYADAGRELAALPAAFDRQPPSRPDETMSAFQRAFDTLVNDTLQSPLLVLTNFDSVYSDLEPETLYCLARFRSEWHDISERIYLVIATWRPLSRLRDDAVPSPPGKGLGRGPAPDTPAPLPSGRGSADDADFVREFSHVFADATIPLNYRGQFRALWESLTYGRPLDARTEELLLRLTGANPGLLRDVVRRLQPRGWLDDPARLAERLAAEPWADAPLPTCDQIWRVLRPEERECLVALAQGRRIDINREQELARLGLLDADGRIFSDVFAATIGRFRAEEERHERGLRIDAANRRVMVDGRPVALRDGRELDILLALYAHRGQVVRYRQLVETIYGEPGLSYDEAMFFSDKEALQRAIARLCERIDPQRAYLINKHGVGYSLSAAVA